MPNDMQGHLSSIERTYMESCRPMAADLIAFMDCQRVTIAPPVLGGSGSWLIAWDGEAHTFTAWGADMKTKVERKCATLDEALRAAHAYVHMLPQEAL